jgi:hypothetical protein
MLDLATELVKLSWNRGRHTIPHYFSRSDISGNGTMTPSMMQVTSLRCSPAKPVDDYLAHGEGKLVRDHRYSLLLGAPYNFMAEIL